MPGKKLEYDPGRDTGELRREMLDFLHFLDIEWPHEVRLAAPVLRKRIGSALDFSQSWESVPKAKPDAEGKIGGKDAEDAKERGEASGSVKEAQKEKEKERIDFSLLPSWKTKPSRASKKVNGPKEDKPDKPILTLRKACVRVSLEESAAKLDGGGTDDSILSEFPPNDCPFVGLRRIALFLAVAHERKRRHIIFITPMKNLYTRLELLGIYAFEAENGGRLPIFKVRCEFAGLMDLADPSFPAPADPILKNCLPEEHMALRILLCQNNGRTLPTESPDVSFFIPLGPLTSMQLGLMAAKAGCAVCGSEDARKCMGCGIFNYCGTKCQTAHWPKHKRDCAPSLSKGRWQPVRYDEFPRTMEGKPMPPFQRTANRRDQIQTMFHKSPPEGDGLKLVTHTVEKPFIVKVQCTERTMLIYDWKRDFEWNVFDMENPKLPVRECLGNLRPIVRPPGVIAGKKFMWARKVSDDELTICLDRFPKQNFRW